MRWPLAICLGCSGHVVGLVGWRRCPAPAEFGRFVGHRGGRVACRHGPARRSAIAFEFGDGADDDDDGAAQWAAGVDLFSEAETNSTADPVEFVEHIQEVRVTDRAMRSLRPDQDNIELAAAGIGHHLIEPWPLGLRAADFVAVLLRRSHSRAERPSGAGREAASPDADRRC